MKTCVLNIAPGKIVKYHDEPCMVLEHRQDGTLLLELDCVIRPFGSGNNYASSSLQAYYNGAYLVSIMDGNPDEIIGPHRPQRFHGVRDGRVQAGPAHTG